MNGYNKDPNQGWQNYGPVGNDNENVIYDAAGARAAGYEDAFGVEETYFEGDLSNPAVLAFAKKVYAFFASALAVATGASVAGVYTVDYLIANQDFATLSTLRIGALVAFFGSFLAVIFMRRSNSPLKTGLLYVFATACGVMIAPMLTFFLQSGMGMSIVYAFGIATTVWGGITVYVLATGKDFRGLGGYLFIGLLVALGLILLNIFIPFPNMLSRMLMCGILVLFVGYTLYDTSRVTRDYFYANDASGAAMMLFYNFFILFKYILLLLAGGRD